MPADLSTIGALVGLGEVALLVVGGFGLLVRRGDSIAEAFTIAVTLALASLSATIQLAFLLGRPRLSLLFESLLLAAALWAVFSARPNLRRSAKCLWSAVQNRPALAALVGTAWAYLGALALLLPPTNPDSLRYHLPRVLLFQQERSLLLPTPEASLAPLSTFPVGSDILAHLFLRFGTDYGLGVFTWVSYVAVVAGAYALARRRVSEPVAITVTLVIASLTELVYMSTAIGKNDVLMTLVGVFCLLIGDRLRERPDGWDTLFLIVGLAFGIAVKTLFLAFALPFVTLYGIEIWRLHRADGVRAILAIPRRWIVLAALLVLVLWQAWLFLHNHLKYGAWSGPPEFTSLVAQHDGWKGTAANITRYAFESLDITKVGDLVVEKATGASAAHWLEQLYDTVFRPIFEGAGASSYFTIKISMSDSKAWFGPLGFLLVLPSLCYAGWRGPHGARLIAWTLITYGIIIAWQIEWTMWHGRYFAVVFVGAAPCLAHLLRRWEMHRFALKALQGASIFLLFYGAVFNEEKQILPLTLREDLFVEGLVHDNIWTKTNWGRDRIAASGDPSALAAIAQELGAAEHVGVLLRDNARFYFYLRSLPSVRFHILPTMVANDLLVTRYEAQGLDKLLCIGLEECPDLATEGDHGGRCERIDGRFNDTCVLQLAAERDRGQCPPEHAGVTDHSPSMSTRDREESRGRAPVGICCRCGHGPVKFFRRRELPPQTRSPRHRRKVDKSAARAPEHRGF